MDHEQAHEFTKLQVGPPKRYACAIPGCKATTGVDLETKEPMPMDSMPMDRPVERSKSDKGKTLGDGF